MEFILKIKEGKKGSELIEFISKLDYVDLISIKNSNAIFDSNGEIVDELEFDRIISIAENSNKIKLDDAILKSEQWKILYQ